MEFPGFNHYGSTETDGVFVTGITLRNDSYPQGGQFYLVWQFSESGGPYYESHDQKHGEYDSLNISDDTIEITLNTGEVQKYSIKLSPTDLRNFISDLRKIYSKSPHILKIELRM